MFRTSTKSIRFQLYMLVPMTLIAVGTALGLGLYVQSRYSVGGPVYDQLSVQNEFLSDVQPSTFLLNQAIIILLKMESAASQTERDQLIDHFDKQESSYRSLRERWLQELPPSEARRLIEVDSHRIAEDIFRIARREYIPLIVSGKPEDLAKANEKLRAIIKRYRDLQEVIDRIIALTNERIAHDQTAAADRVRFWSTLNIAMSLFAVSFLVTIKWFVARNIVRATDSLNNRLSQLAQGAGDLTARVPESGTDELRQLAVHINGMIAKIQSIVCKVREASLQLLSVASEIAATARQQEQTVQNLSASTTQVAASVREISATSKDLSGTMGEVNQSATHAAELAARGRDNTTRMADEMKHLVDSTASVSAKLGMIREKADSINAVVITITKVADQTNLLSINAAIEAEKAGEYGRGFLVVAREIRRLADQTAVATLDIETMVRQMQDAVSAGVMQMDKFADEVRSGVGQVYSINQMTYEIIGEVQTLSDRFQLVNEGMRNQSIGAEQINEAMGHMADGARRSAQSVQDFERATTHLRGSVESLNQEIAQFKL